MLFLSFVISVYSAITPPKMATRTMEIIPRAIRAPFLGIFDSFVLLKFDTQPK